MTLYTGILSIAGGIVGSIIATYIVRWIDKKFSGRKNDRHDK